MAALRTGLEEEGGPVHKVNFAEEGPVHRVHFAEVAGHKEHPVEVVVHRVCSEGGTVRRVHSAEGVADTAPAAGAGVTGTGQLAGHPAGARARYIRSAAAGMILGPALGPVLGPEADTGTAHRDWEMIQGIRRAGHLGKEEHRIPEGAVGRSKAVENS